MKVLSKIFMFWLGISNKYDVIKKDPQKRENSIRFGVTSLIMSIVGIALTVGFAVFAYYCFLGMETLAFLFALIAGIACAGAAIGCFLHLVLASIVYAVYQLKLNKKAIGKIALVISLLISISTIVIVIISFTQFTN